MMLDRAPESAPEVFRGLLRDAGLGERSLTPAAVRPVFLDFARLDFKVPDEDQADGVLYQYGTYSFSGEPCFYFDLVRQFALNDSDEYLQFHCEFRFDCADPLTKLGGYHQWWFRENGAKLDDWFAAIAARPEWDVVSRFAPVAVDIRYEET